MPNLKFQDEHHILKATSISQRDDTDNVLGSLVWGIRKSYPRITQYVNTTEDTPLVYIAPMNSILVESVLLTMCEVYSGEHDNIKKIACYNIEYVDDKKTDNVVLQATINIEKDTAGINYLYLTVKDKPVVKFKLMPDLRWHKFLNRNNEEITDVGVLSSLYARAYMHRVRSSLDACLTKYVKIVEPKKLSDRATPKKPTMELAAVLDDFISDGS